MWTNKSTSNKSTRQLDPFLLLALSLAALLCGVATASNETVSYSERFELCKTDADIEALLETYGPLIQVSSAPTNAAM